MVSIKIYVEGGGDSESLHRKCRAGFRTFLEKNPRFKNRSKPTIVASGSRGKAYDDFKTACEQGKIAILLIDSEDLVSSSSPWEHLLNRKGDGFPRPNNAGDEHCHLMVTCMESWFLADKEAVFGYFGQGFNQNALPKSVDIEKVTKEDIYRGLNLACSRCTDKSKTSYDKGDHSFEILKRLDHHKVITASKWAKRLVDELDRLMPNYSTPR